MKWIGCISLCSVLMMFVVGCRKDQPVWALNNANEPIPFIKQALGPSGNPSDSLCMPALALSLAIFRGISNFPFDQRQILSEADLDFSGRLSLNEFHDYFHYQYGLPMIRIWQPTWQDYTRTLQNCIRWDSPPLLPVVPAHANLVAGYSKRKDNGQLTGFYTMEPLKAGSVNKAYHHLTLDKAEQEYEASGFAGFYSVAPDTSFPFMGHNVKSLVNEIPKDESLPKILSEDVQEPDRTPATLDELLPTTIPLQPAPDEGGSDDDTTLTHVINLSYTALGEAGAEDLTNPVGVLPDFQVLQSAQFGTPIEVTNLEAARCSRDKCPDKRFYFVPALDDQGSFVGQVNIGVVNDTGFIYRAMTALLNQPPGNSVTPVNSGIYLPQDFKTTYPGAIVTAFWANNDLGVSSLWPFYKVTKDGFTRIYCSIGGWEVDWNGYMLRATGDRRESQGYPSRKVLLGNFPNPFNPTTTIQFNIPISGRVTVKIYNLLGEVVAELLDEERPAGRHQLEFKGVDRFGHHLPSSFRRLSI